MNASRNPLARALASSMILVVVLALSACSPSYRVDFIPEGPEHTADGLERALDASEPGKVVGLSSEDAANARQQALSDLRTNGEDAGLLADTLTSEFPVDVLAVPYRVERATYEGAPAWVVFEAWGEPGGNLSHKRLWVFTYDERSLVATQSQR